MKIAICLHGLASGVNDVGIPVSFKEGIESIKKNIVGDHDVDIFFHTWSKDSEKELVKDYKPCRYKVEEQIIFEHPFGVESTQYSFTPETTVKLQSMYSRWYSLAECMKLKREQEKETGEEYDFVLSARFDMVFYEPFIDFNKLDQSCFYISNWWHNKFNFGYNGPWFVSGSNQMDRVGELYEHLNTYLEENSDYEKYVMSLPETAPRERPEIDNKVSNHGLLRWHVKGAMSMETNFIGLEYQTWSLSRRISLGRNNPHFPNGLPYPLNEPAAEERACVMHDGPRGVGW